MNKCTCTTRTYTLHPPRLIFLLAPVPVILALFLLKVWQKKKLSIGSGGRWLCRTGRRRSIRFKSRFLTYPDLDKAAVQFLRLSSTISLLPTINSIYLYIHPSAHAMYRCTPVQLHSARLICTPSFWAVVNESGATVVRHWCSLGGIGGDNNVLFGISIEQTEVIKSVTSH